MAKAVNPGVVIAIFLNVILLLGIPFFGKGEASRLGPLILLALAMPWILCWGVGRIVTGIREQSTRDQENDGPPDFV